MHCTSRAIELAARHARLLAWIALYAVFFALIARNAPSLHIAAVVAATTLAPMVLVGETLRRVLLPRLIHRRPLLFFLLTLALLWAVTLIAVRADKGLIAHFGMPMPGVRDGNMGNPDIYFHLKYTFLLVATAAQATVSFLLDEQRRLAALRHEEQMQMELRYLRSQINPHFLFNALNSLYALSTMHDQRTPRAVLQLSEMMRYAIDDSAAERVALQKELRNLQNYIDFYRLRLEHDEGITYDDRGVPADAAASVPPMILQPLVENCFKHSRIGHLPNAFVSISVRLVGRRIVFESSNSFEPSNASADIENLGIGLTNTRQRLSLTYGDDFRLVTSTADGIYHLTLELPA